MSRSHYYVYIVFCLCAILLALAGGRTQAEEPAGVRKYDREISEAKQSQKGLEQKVEELQKEMEEIEKNRDKMLVYIEKLDKKGVVLEQNLEKLKGQIRTFREDLDKASSDLAEAEEQEERQYAAMKKRIKYMYEKGHQDYWEILLKSRNMGELLNRAEYIEKISAYDRNIFSEYRELKQTVAQKKQEIEENLAQQEDAKAEQVAKRKALAELKTRKEKELRNYSERLNISQEKADEYARQAAEAEMAIEKLLQERQAEINRQNAVGQGDSGGGGALRWPLNVAGNISSSFGKRNSPTAGASTDHRGIDIAAPEGTPIVAAGSGQVAAASYSASAGNYVMIAHGNNLFTVYMHCSRLATTEGEAVTAGQVIAYVGSTGISTGAHLHFGVSKNGAYLDPMEYVSQK